MSLYTCLSIYISLLRTASSRPSETWYIAYVSIRICQHTSAYVCSKPSIRFPSETCYMAYVSICIYHTCLSLYVSLYVSLYIYVAKRAYVRMCQHTSAYVSISRYHTCLSMYVSLYVSLYLCVSIYMSHYICSKASIRQHTSAYVSVCI